jgi:hypothetical protein
MFPQMDIAMPHIVHFLFIDFEYWLKRMWLVAVDVSTNSVMSIVPYINGEEDCGTEDFDLTKQKSDDPKSFLPCEFSRFLHVSRYNIFLHLLLHICCKLFVTLYILFASHYCRA